MTDPRTDPPAAGNAASEAQDEPEKPLGISLLTWLLWFWAGAIVLVLFGLAVGDGPVMLNGRAVPRAEALGRVFPALASMGLAVVGAALALTLDRPWARPAALLPFLLAALGPSMTGVGARSGTDFALAILAVVPMLALLGWYLYARPRTTAWFARLRAQRREGREGA